MELFGNARRCASGILHLEDPTFRKHYFRMTKVVFDRLVQAVGLQRQRSELLERSRTPVAEATLIGLWVLFNPDTFRSEGLNFDVAPSVVHHHYEVLLKVLCDLGSKYIKWPSAIERERTALYYERNFGFPGVIGCIDGTLIRITAPNHQKQRYVDRHDNYSINVQIVSDHKRLIRDFFGGMPGSVNDACIFRRSPLAKNLYSRPDMVDADQHLIGDCAYVNTTEVLSPYKDYGNLTPRHRNFNYVLSQCRATVERLNALYKHRLSRLRRLFCKSENCEAHSLTKIGSRTSV